MATFTSGPNTNDTFDADYIEENGSCQATNTYRWGFSFLLLFISAFLTVLWALGMHIMWLDAYFGSYYEQAQRSMGIHRDVLDFASAMIKDMGDEIPPEHVSEKGLVRRRKKALNGGKVPRLDPINGNRDETSVLPRTRAEDLRDWLNRRRWGRIVRRCKWLLLVLLVVAVGMACVMVPLMTNNRPACSVFGCHA
jgi:hypothetical protein